MKFLLLALAFLPAVLSQGCGQTYSMGGRVISGQNARAGAWPWQALIYSGGQTHCGGTLIAANWVLTAAHCVRGQERRPGQFRIVMGDNNFDVRDGSEQMFRVSAIISHRAFSFQHFDSDIALMKLDRPAVLNGRVNVACLPSSGAAVPVGTSCYITGFGKVRHPGSMHPQLQQARMNVVDNRICRQFNGRTGITVTNSMLCAGDGGRSRVGGCHGDSGGPFVCQSRGGQWFVHGAVSWGSNDCRSSSSYTVFARVSYLRNWIDQQMRNN